MSVAWPGPSTVPVKIGGPKKENVGLEDDVERGLFRVSEGVRNCRLVPTATPGPLTIVPGVLSLELKGKSLGRRFAAVAWTSLDLAVVGWAGDVTMPKFEVFEYWSWLRFANPSRPPMSMATLVAPPH